MVGLVACFLLYSFIFLLPTLHVHMPMHIHTNTHMSVFPTKLSGHSETLYQKDLSEQTFKCKTARMM